MRGGGEKAGGKRREYVSRKDDVRFHRVSHA